MAAEPYPDLEKLCRLCLQCSEATNTLVDIFPQATTATAAKAAPPLSIPMRIMACAALEVQPNDGLPKAICTKCRFQLEKSYYFRKRSQLSDSKLRKHIRLLNLGKKSRVFNKPTDDEELEDEDELEFEESLRFIAEHDEQQERDKLRQQLEQEMEQKLAQHRQKCELELREKLQVELRPTIEDEVRRELCSEQEAMEKQLREELRLESIEIARVEVRAEVMKECRQLEREILLLELEQFLKNKRETDENTKAVASNSKPEEYESDAASHNITSITRKASKRRASSPLEKQVRIVKVQGAHAKAAAADSDAGNDENKAALVPFESVAIANEVDGEVLEDGMEQVQNYYIFESDDDNENETMAASVEQDQEQEQEEEQNEEIDYFEKKPEIENFQLTATEIRSKAKDTTSYEIKKTSEITFCKKSNSDESENGGDCDTGNEEVDGHVIVFNFEEDMDGEQADSVGLMNLENKIVLLKSVNQTKSSEGDDNIAEIAADSPPTFTKRINGSEPALATLNTKTTEVPLQRVTDTVKTFKCTSCPVVFSTENSLNRHMRTHRKFGQRGVAYQCTHCQIHFSCKSALTRHMIIHTGERPYVCEECGKSFVQREVLKRHMHTHTGDRPHKCPHCYRSFAQRVNLTHHVNRQHSDVIVLQQYSCHLCPKRFNHASGLSRHLASHSGLTFQCTKCTRKFGDRSSMKRHIANVHGKMSKGKQNQLLQESEEVVQRSEENSIEFVT